MTKDNINLYSKEQTDALLSDKADTDDLATVALTGSYNDLTDKPTIPEINLYPGTGQNTDGAMTQKAVTDALPSSSELVPDFTSAAQGSVLTRTTSGVMWAVPGASISISDMGTFYRITY